MKVTAPVLAVLCIAPRFKMRWVDEASDKPVDLIGQLGGWSLQTVGQGYGNGYPMSVLRSEMEKIN